MCKTHKKQIDEYGTSKHKNAVPYKREKYKHKYRDDYV